MLQKTADSEREMTDRTGPLKLLLATYKRFFVVIWHTSVEEGNVFPQLLLTGISFKVRLLF